MITANADVVTGEVSTTGVIEVGEICNTNTFHTYEDACSLYPLFWVYSIPQYLCKLNFRLNLLKCLALDFINNQAYQPQAI